MTTQAAAAAEACYHTSTDAVPERDRLGYWQEILSSLFVPVRIKTLSTAPFRYEAMSRRAGKLGFARVRGTPLESNICPSDDSGENFMLAMPNHSSSLVRTHRKWELLARGGEIMLMGPAIRGQMGVLSDTEVDFTVWTVPRNALEAMGIVSADLALPLSPEHGVGSLIAMYMRHWGDRVQTLDPVERALFDRQFIELVALAAGRDRERIDIGRESVRQAQFNRVIAHIGVHLYDPSLSPRKVAEAMQISVRYLHLLFEAKGIRFSEWVLERRLQEAHRVLTSNAGRNQTVVNIAFACGFSNLSAFYQRFRQRYGMSPGDAQRLGGDTKE